MRWGESNLGEGTPLDNVPPVFRVRAGGTKGDLQLYCTSETLPFTNVIFISL